MIISRITGGLGNQLFQYAAGLALARRQNQTLLLDDRCGAFESSRRFLLDQFRVTASRVGGPLRLALGALGHPRVGRACRRLAARRPLSLHVVDETQLGYRPPLPAGAGRSVLLWGNWESEQFFADAAGDVRAHFQLVSEPTGPNRAMLDEIADGDSVCVHVRRGDKVSDPRWRQVFAACGPDYYRLAASHLRERVARPRFYVFSDDPAWAARHVDLGPGTTHVTHNAAGGVADVEDFRLMCACRHFVIANSTFSWWAAWLGAAADKRVVAPGKWFLTDHPRWPHLIPSGWTTVWPDAGHDAPARPAHGRAA